MHSLVRLCLEARLPAAKVAAQTVETTAGKLRYWSQAELEQSLCRSTAEEVVPGVSTTTTMVQECMYSMVMEMVGQALGEESVEHPKPAAESDELVSPCLAAAAVLLKRLVAKGELCCAQVSLAKGSMPVYWLPPPKPALVSQPSTAAKKRASLGIQGAAAKKSRSSLSRGAFKSPLLVAAPPSSRIASTKTTTTASFVQQQQQQLGTVSLKPLQARLRRLQQESKAVQDLERVLQLVERYQDSQEDVKLEALVEKWKMGTRAIVTELKARIQEQTGGAQQQQQQQQNPFWEEPAPALAVNPFAYEPEGTELCERECADMGDSQMDFPSPPTRNVPAALTIKSMLQAMGVHELEEMFSDYDEENDCFTAV